MRKSRRIGRKKEDYELGKESQRLVVVSFLDKEREIKCI